ncbi:MAG: hypothetical protein BBJ60_02270 [Desulfobacterales bacterium S7086C20]|nr:MAG: hypothetical protein BBJ60_02270 [Desulfobacterales bacterium S7086C20]
MVLKSLRKKAYEKRLRRYNVPEVFFKSFMHATALDTKGSIKDTKFVVVDTEATGFRPEKGDVLLSVAGLGVSNGRLDLSRSFYELIKPGRDIPHESVVVHNLTPDKLRNLLPVSEVLLRFFEFCKGDILVGHHSSFDMRFLNHALKQNFKITMANRVLDTAMIARAMQEIEDPTRVAMEGTKHVTLDKLATRFGIGMPDRHDAYGDALATALIFQRQAGLLRQQNIFKLKDLLNMGEVR